MHWLKNKKVIIILSSIFVVGLGGYFLFRDTSVLEIKQKVVSYEYGDKVELTAKDLLKNTDKDVLTSAKIESTLENETDKEYPKLGKYVATISYKKEKVKVEIEIKDTKAPVFNNCNIVEFVKGIDFDYNQYIIATDLQGVTYDFKKEAVDINTVGEYTMQVIATDDSKNQATKDIKVTVLEAVDTSTNEVSTSTDDNGNVKVTITQKPKSEVPSTNSTNITTDKSPTPKPDTSTPASTPTPKPKPEELHQHLSIFLSPLFDTKSQCDTWAESYLDSDQNFYNTKYNGYGTSTCHCGKWGVDSFY